MDLESVEVAIRRAVLSAGAKAIEQLLEPVGIGRVEQPIICGCGTTMKSVGIRPKKVLTLLGEITFRRSCFRCPRCSNTHSPGDVQLDIVRSSRSPGIRRQTVRLGAKEPFQEVSEDMRELAGINLCRKEAERISEKEGVRMEKWMAEERAKYRFNNPPVPLLRHPIDTLYIEMDGTGIPMAPKELVGKKGKQQDGSAKTREAKVGCVFTQTTLDETGNPVRDPASTTYVGAIEQAAAFAQRLYTESVRRGLYQAKRVIVIGDGAEWVKNIAQTQFGNAQFIIDYYHAVEHIGKLARAIFVRDLKQAEEWREHWTGMLWHGEVQSIIEQAEKRLSPRNKEGKREIEYFRKNSQYMQYHKFRAEKCFIGSGVIEAACKNLVGQRLKRSGMEWSVAGANSILAARCTLLSNRLDDYWDDRVAS